MNHRRVALQAVKKAAKVVRKYYTESLQQQTKGAAGKDFVTKADLESEEILVSTLKEHFSDHNFLTEESHTENNDSAYTWIIDPLDGTTNFVRQIPFFSISIALAKDKEVIFGIVYAIMQDELFVAERGKGATVNGKPICVTNNKTVNKAIISHNFNYEKREKDFLDIEKLFFQVEGIRLLHATALELCYVACGRYDAYIVRDSNPWDIAAGALVVEEAKGKVTNFLGKKWQYLEPTLLTTNNQLHDKLLALL